MRNRGTVVLVLGILHQSEQKNNMHIIGLFEAGVNPINIGKRLIFSLSF